MFGVVGLVRWPFFGCFTVEWICLGVVVKVRYHLYITVC